MKGIISKVAILLTIFSTSAFASTDEEIVNVNVNITVKSAVEPEHVIATTTLHLFEFEVNLGTHEVDGVKVKNFASSSQGRRPNGPSHSFSAILHTDNTIEAVYYTEVCGKLKQRGSVDSFASETEILSENKKCKMTVLIED